MINIILADDHIIVRNGIRNLLENEPDICIVGEATNGREVLSILTHTPVDIILADIDMPDTGGIELAAALKERANPAHVILLTMHDEQQYVLEAFKNGAAAYLIKSIDSQELLYAIRHVYNGRKYLCNELSLRLLDRLVSASAPIEDNEQANIELSERELSILKLIAEGYTNQEIADKLFTSKRTVEGHRQALIDKTGVRNTPALIRFALRRGIIK